jgi:hypothetical protein
VDEVVLEYQLTFDEFRQGRLGGSFRKNLIFIVLVCFLAAIFTVASIAGHSVTEAILSPALAIGFIWLTLWFEPKRMWNQQIGQQEPRTVTFGDDGVKIKSRSRETTYEWSRLARVKETNDFIMFFPKRGPQTLFVLKRGVCSEEDQEKLGRILLAHFPPSP